MNAVQVVVADAPDQTDLAVISDGLDHFNIDASGVADRRPLAVLVEDSQTNPLLSGERSTLDHPA